MIENDRLKCYQILVFRFSLKKWYVNGPLDDKSEPGSNVIGKAYSGKGYIKGKDPKIEVNLASVRKRKKTSILILGE